VGGLDDVSNATVGVLGQSQTGTSNNTSFGVFGVAQGTGSIGVSGTGDAYGVKGISTSGSAVYGTSTSGYGLYGVSTSGFGLYATSTSNDGLHGEVNGAYSGVVGKNYYTTAGSNPGVYGWSQAGYAGYFVSGGGSTVAGVYANGLNGIYAHGNGTGSTGVYADCSGTNCVAAYWVGSMNMAVGNKYEYGGSCFAGACSSDQRLKKGIEPLTGALDQLLRIKGVSFEWKNPEEHGNKTGKQTGFIAQEVEKAFPAWVEEDKDGFKAIALPPMHLAALEVESIRELKAKNDALEARLKQLEDERKPIISTNTNGLGFAIGGLALAAGAVIVTRRRRAEERSTAQ
jgi:hypothetical protein